jgi:hypothetical protein
MTLPRCPRCLSIVLVCACVAQGAQAPPASVVSWIVSPGFSLTTSSIASTMTIMVNSVTGVKPYDVSPARKPPYGEHDEPLVVIHYWRPPDPSET